MGNGIVTYKNLQLSWPSDRIIVATTTQYVLNSENCIIEGGNEQIAFVHPHTFIAVGPGDDLTVTLSVSDKFCNSLLTYYLIKSMDIPDLLTYFLIKFLTFQKVRFFEMLMRTERKF